ncbi:hypothetical protein NHE_0298 [Neorickettsia helminthoeca str. Oregon]|uniref:Uncharacterized protein n=1 Tax=Neorickettsia helminthoeca str. Oregon TaxID=1286528 RepID=X5GW05_9RICK|nr:hypothetical protein NHE_0298 [Neorickettsia helminthoeca str. Oregon]
MSDLSKHQLCFLLFIINAKPGNIALNHMDILGKIGKKNPILC